MDIHEYQAKEILARFGVPVPKGALAYSPEQAAYRAREIGGKLWVVKAQVHTGGRGKAGGVKLCRSEDEVMEAADDLLGKSAAVSIEVADGTQRWFHGVVSAFGLTTVRWRNTASLKRKPVSSSPSTALLHSMFRHR